MRRSVTFAAALLVVVAGASGCSGSSEAPPAPLPSVNAIGNPSDTASPVDTYRPPPTEAEPPSPTPTAARTAGASGAPTPTDPAAAALAACLNGNWTAPVSREFDGLGIGPRSKGTVRSGTGLLRLTLGRDQTFTFTYDEVKLSLAAGTAGVSGPVSGTWSLAGNTMRTVLVKRSTKVTVTLGPVTVGAPAAVADAVETLPPAEVLVTCSDPQLIMQLPTGQGGGAVTFDRA